MLSENLGTRYLQVRLASEEYELLQERAKGAGLSLQRYVRNLLVQHLEGEPAKPPYARTRKNHELLEYILQNDKKAAESIKTSLRLIAEAIEARQKPTRARRAGGA